MSDNIVNFPSQEDCEHEHVCPHCEQRDKTIVNFLDRVEGLDTDSEEFIDEVEMLIDFVEMYTKRETLAGLVSGLVHEINVIDGDEEEEYEE